MFSKLNKKVVPIAAAVLIILAGVGFYSAIQAATQPESVMVAVSNIPAFTNVQSSQLKAESVPKGSVTSEDLTQSEYQSEYIRSHKPLIVTMEILSGQRIDRRVIATSARSSFDIVSPDERVIAVTSSTAGAALGTINAGDVVDVSTSSNAGSSGGASTTFAKVICISTSVTGCAGVLPPGVSLTISSSGSSSTTTPGQGQVYVLLSVAATDATALAGQNVNLALNPFCVVGSTAPGIRPDQFVSAIPNVPCQAPANRDATLSGPLSSLPSAGTLATSTGSTGSTGNTSAP